MCNIVIVSKFRNKNIFLIILSCRIKYSFYKYFITLISAQREGGLSDSTSPDIDQTDPFYAHCKLHVDKLTVK